MAEEQFQELKDSNFAHNNLPKLVSGLNAYGFKVKMPESAEDYREQVYPALLDFLKQAGYAAVEIPVNSGTLQQCSELRKLIEDRKLKVTGVGMRGDDLEASLKALVDRTHAIGAKLVVGPFVLQFKVVPENTIGDDRVKWVRKKVKSLVEPIRNVAKYGKSKDVKIAVEPLNRFELPGMNRLQEAINFAKAVDHPNFGVMIDTCHEFSDGEGPGKFARQVKTLMEMNKLFHCHISAIHRGRIDKSWIQWGPFFGTLIKNGYKGNMSMEIFDSTKPFSEVVHINRPSFKNPPEVALSALLITAKRLQKLEEKK